MKKKSTFLILSVLVCLISMAQTYDPTSKFPSPGAAELGRFSAAKVGLYTGTAQYSIPIYEFKTPNLSLPVTLDYSSNGLMVDKIASWVGFDWSLSVGGVINRFRKGKVDKPGSRPAYPTNWNSWTATDRYNFLESYVSNTADLEPDEFIFNFPNYSGKFVFDENGVPVLLPYANLKIETNTSGQNYTFFKITTPDGIIYRFENVAYTYPTSEPSFISSWYLTQIIHPLGDIITFNYTNISLTQYIGVSQSATTVVATSGQNPGCSGGQVNETVNSVYNDALFLSSINFQNYGNITFEKYQTRQDSYHDYQLKKISIRDNSNVLIKSFEFFQQFPLRSSGYQSKTNLGITEPNSEHNKRMFLDSLQLQANDGSRTGSYAFYYNNLDQLPARYSYAQDHWGYFNGKTNADFAVISDVPPSYQNFFTNMVPTVANRNPDYTYSQKGMLQKIVFPTKGFTTIEYEPNKNSTNDDLGGCRVLRTKIYTSNAGTPEIRKYIYSGSQSSISYKYYNQYTTNSFSNLCNWLSSCTYGVLSSNSADNLFVNGINNVIYSNIEIRWGENAENGKEVHQFYSDIDVPGTPLNGGQIYPLVKYNTGWKGGLLASNYNTNATLSKVREKDLTYNFTETRNLRTINCLAVEWLYAPGCQPKLDYLRLQRFNVVPYTLSSVWYYINQEQITNYQSNGNVISTVNYFYDNAAHAQLTREETTDSKGIKLIKTYKYPLDYPSSTMTNPCETTRQSCIAAAVSARDQGIAGCPQVPPSTASARATCIGFFTSTYDNAVAQCQSNYESCNPSDQQIITEMQNKNMISPVIEEQTSQFKNNITTLTKGTINKFKKENGLILPDEKYELELTNPESDLTSSSINASGTLIFHPKYSKKLIYDKYDTKGNILQYHLSDNNNTSFLWCYNGTLPVIKGENVTYDILNAAVIAAGASNPETFWNGFNNIATDVTQQATWKNFNAALRSNKTIANAQVTTYTYLPLIGMTSQTDPNGMTTYYEYDAFGRLNLVKDKDGNILKTYNYHYQNQE